MTNNTVKLTKKQREQAWESLAKGEVHFERVATIETYKGKTPRGKVVNKPAVRLHSEVKEKVNEQGIRSLQNLKYQK